MLFYKIIRFTAVVLLFAALFTLITGFLLVKFNLVPWFSYSTYKYIHTVIMPLIFVPIFYLHALAGLMILINRSNNARKIIWQFIVGIIWTSVFVGLGFLYFVDNPTPEIFEPTEESTTEIQINDGGVSVIETKKELVSLTMSEISKHSSASSCWLLLSGKVYDVTSFLSEHPGEAKAILPNCGKDGTAAYATKGKKGIDHSNDAKDLLTNYYIGDVGSQVSGETISTKQEQNPANTIIENGSEKETEEKSFNESLVQKNFPGSQIIEMEINDQGGYEAKILINGVKHEVKVDSQGIVIKDSIDN